MLAVEIPVPALWSLQKGSVCACGSALWVHAWARAWDSPRLRHASPRQPFPSSSQPGAGDAPGDGAAPVPTGSPEPGSCCPGDTAAGLGGLRSDTPLAAAVTCLGQRVTAQVPSKINTLDCLKQTGAPGQGKALAGRATQAQVTTPGPSDLPDPKPSHTR